jgi:hypothetical protein
MGVPSLILDRAAGPPSHPQAHCISNRTMELLRSLPIGVGNIPASVAVRSNTSPTPESTAGRTLEGAATVKDQRGRNKSAESVADAVQAAAPPFEQWRRFRYVTRLTGGDVLGVVDHFPGEPCVRAGCLVATNDSCGVVLQLHNAGFIAGCQLMQYMKRMYGGTLCSTQRL